MPDVPHGFDPLAWGGYILAFIGTAGTWIATRRKSNVDEATLILGKWKDMVEAHEHAIDRMQEQLAGATAERTAARIELTELRAAYNLELDALRSRVRALEDENTGLKRQLAQRSQSMAMRLDTTEAPATAAAMRRQGIEPRIIMAPDPDMDLVNKLEGDA